MLYDKNWSKPDLTYPSVRGLAHLLRNPGLRAGVCFEDTATYIALSFWPGSVDHAARCGDLRQMLAMGSVSLDDHDRILFGQFNGRRPELTEIADRLDAFEASRGGNERTFLNLLSGLRIGC